MTIFVHGQYSIGSDKSLTFVDQTGFSMYQTSFRKPPEILNFGTVDVINDQDGSITGVTSSAYPDQGGVFWNEAGGIFRVTASSAQGYAIGFDGPSWCSDFTNDGLFVVSAGAGAYGVQASDLSFIFTNTGEFRVDGGGDARGVSYQNGLFLNDGLFEVHAGTGLAVGASVGSFGASVNSGRMVVTDGNQSLDSIALEFLTSTNGPEDFTNSGSIVAKDYALEEVFTGTGDCRQFITNTGKINGIIDLGVAADILHNSGAVRGDIFLGAGDDVYDGGGKHVGALYGESGADTLSGGKGADHIFGDGAVDFPNDGADVIDGGAGADVLSGGGGDDTFVFSRLKDTSVLNPDLITDLTNDDAIDLAAIDADTTQKGDQAFHLAGSLDGHAGEAALVYDSAEDVTRLELDVDGDGHADATVLLAGDHTDFIHFVL